MSPFGERLRAWRRRRGMTQLELALSAGSTPRYISFIETGRARPGRDVVARVAAALDLLPRERNALLVAAGLPPEHTTHRLDDETMKPVRRVVEAMLANHEPFPGWCIGRGYRFLASNCGAERLFPGMMHMSPEQLVDFSFGPGPMRDMVENWQDVVHAGLGVLRRELMVSHDPTLLALVERASAHLEGVAIPSPAVDVPVVCPILRLGSDRVRTISTVMRFDNAADVTASELKVELMFPADAESELVLRRLCAPA